MSNVIETTQNSTEPLVMASDAKARDDLTIASGTFVKGEVVFVSGGAIVKYVPATNVPNAVLLEAQDASGGALTGVSGLIKGEVDARQVVFTSGDADSANVIYGPSLSSRECLALASIYLVDTRSVDAQQL